MVFTVGMTNSEQEAGYHEWTVGDRLRAARESVTSDRKHFAEMIGVAPGTIRNYERDIYKPKRPVLTAWCLATGFNREWVETGHMPEGPNDGGEVAAPVTLRQLRRIPRDNRILLKSAA